MGFYPTEDGWKAFDLEARPEKELPVFGVSGRYPAGSVVPMHQHPQGHLIYADSGLLRVQAESGQWLVPPTAAVWLRSGVAHSLAMPVTLQAYGLFVRQDVCARLPTFDCVVHVSPLLRELIITLAQAREENMSAKRMRLLGALVMEEVLTQPTLPFHLPWPMNETDGPMARLCQALLDDPGDMATAGEWADRLAMGQKTFHRRFLQSTGMTFGKWRQQLRLMSSLPLLMQGMPITQVALASGYDSHSAYTTAFGKQFGKPPSAFFPAREPC
ncbi:AraC family transcriptional regulator [Herbaspirillum seropedicae]|uniref:AraC family transcriptional regulator n=1 Tax=Herbaspirillum seropedicae TaxID=964 RepID=UPI003FCE718B